MLVYGCFLAFLCAGVQVVLLTSANTPFDIHAVLSLVPPLSSVSWAVVSIDSLEQFSPEAEALVLDYSYKPAVCPQRWPAFQASTVVGMYADAHYSLQGQVSSQELAQRIVQFLSEIDRTAVLLATSVPSYQRLAAVLSANGSLSYAETVSLPRSLALRAAEQFVGRLLKPSGSLTALLYLDQESGAQVLPLLQTYHVYKAGYVYLTSQEAAWTQPLDGLFYFTDSAAVNATDRVSFEALVLFDRLQQLRTSSHLRKTLSLVNIVYGEAHVVTATATRVFPGDATSVSKVARPTVEVWADLEGKSQDGSVYKPWKAISIGTVVAYETANRDRAFPYQFVNVSKSFGAMNFNRTWAVTQIQQSAPGVAYHGFLLTSTVYSLYSTFRSLNLTLPVTSLSISSGLSNRTEYPLFVRTISSSATVAMVMTRFFQVFGWHSVAVVYSTGMVDVEFYNHLRSFAPAANIRIANNETLRQVPLHLANAQAELNSTLLDVLNSTVRVVVVFHTYAYSVAARLYDLGARPGDFLLCLGYVVTGNAGSDPADFANGLKILNGAMVFRDRMFAGPDGPALKTEVLSRLNDSFDPQCCFTYDSAMLVAHAVQDMLFRGEHFEDGEKLMESVRTTRFKGCLGPIQIESDSNDIRLNEFSLQIIHTSESSDAFSFVEGAIYSPLEVRLFRFLPSLSFPDGSNSTFLDSWAMQPGCPFLAKNMRDFAPGEFLAASLNFGIVAVHVCVFSLIAFKLRTRRPALLTQKQAMSLQDGLFLYQHCVHTLQVLVLGPQLPLPGSFTNAIGIASFNVWGVVRFAPGVFAGFEIATFVLIPIYVALYLLRLPRLYLRLKSSRTCKLLSWWSKLLVPPISSLLFLPIVSVLLSTNVCVQAAGPAFTESFLFADCWQSCWTDTHLAFVAVSFVLLNVYILLAVLHRVAWVSQSLHMRSTAGCTVCKALLLLLQIATNVTFKNTRPVLHASVYVAAQAAYTALICFVKPYNYERLNLWERITALGACYYGAITLIHAVTPMSTKCLAVLLAAGAGVLCAGGVLLQSCVVKYRSLLYRRKEDRYEIIKFAFTFGSRAQTHLRNFQRQIQLASVETPSALPALSRRVPRPRMTIHGVRGSLSNLT